MTVCMHMCTQCKCVCACAEVIQIFTSTNLCQHTPDWRWHVTVLMLVFKATVTR